ncbi:MAG: PIG-L deacetylase family protein [bacterium]
MSRNPNERKTIFACFAHADDEIGALGTLANHVERGDRVILAWTTYGEMTSLFGDIPVEEIIRRRKEHATKVSQVIGCEIMFLEYGDAQIEVNRESALRMAKAIAEIKPDAVITWNTIRGHPDHRGTAQLIIDGITYARLPRVVAPLEAHRADIPIYFYADPHSHYPVVYVDITDQMDKVVEVAEHYGKEYDWPDIEERIRMHRRSVGSECGVKYAEKFNVMRRHEPAQKYLV